MRDFMNRCRTARDDEGFTLIELLVVVVIIGVLVAIAVPVYLNYRKGAADKSAQSDVRGAVSAVEQFYADNGNVLPGTVKGQSVPSIVLALPSNPNTQTITLSDKTELGYVNKTDHYLICGTNDGGSGKWYVYDSSVGGSVQGSTPSAALSLDTCH